MNCDNFSDNRTVINGAPRNGNVRLFVLRPSVTSRVTCYSFLTLIAHTKQ